MRNIRFSCLECGQHLLAEGEWCGRDIHCPGCAQLITIPDPAPAQAENVAPPAHANGHHNGALLSELGVARARLDAVLAERDATLAERDTALHKGETVSRERAAVLRALETEKIATAALRTERDTLSAAARHLKDLLGARDFERNVLQTMLKKANATLMEREEHIRHIQSGHEATLADLAESKRLITGSETQLQASRAEFQNATEENKRLSNHLQKQEQLLAESRAEGAETGRTAEKLRTDLQETKAELVRVLAARDHAEAERAKLRADLATNVDLVEFLRLKETKGVTESALAENHRKLAEALAGIENLRDTLRKSHEDRVRVELELAKTRDALRSSKQEQDNEILRALVARLNEELEDYRPVTRRGLAKRAAARARRSPWSHIGFFRWLWSRCVVVPER